MEMCWRDILRSSLILRVHLEGGRAVKQEEEDSRDW